MKQTSFLNRNIEEGQSEPKYSTKIETPIYEPKNKQPHILELCNKEKTYQLISKIEKSQISQEEKNFLIDAAQRHIVFNYEKIADYYSHASKEMQELMESSALVIIDFEKAIELGFIKLCKEIKQQYLETYEK